MSLSKPIFMSPSKPLLQLLNCANKNQSSKTTNSRRRDTDDALGFLKAVKLAFKYDKKNYDGFIKVLRDFSAKRILKNPLHISGLKAKVKHLFKGHVDLVSEFNKFMPKEHRITLLRETTGKNEKLGEICQLPWDVLDVISQKLDFEELFQFSGVCKNWRTFHKSNFLSSQEPFFIEISGYPYRGRSYCFISLSNKKVYNLKKMMRKMVSYSKLTRPMYVGYSSGYFIIKTDSSTFLLINPFTRIKKVINSSSLFELDYTIDQFHGLLAFQKCSEEFVLLVLCKKYGSLYVYQSRNNGWVTYFRKGKREMIHDIMVLNNIIYVVTNKGRIGVVSLNSTNIKFRKLKNTSNIVTFSNLYLVNYDEQLLVVGLNPARFGRLGRVVYKIDWLTMRYVELKSLGDIALFHVEGKCCKSLSNPNRWGYESNSVYEVDLPINKYSVYNWDKEWDKKYMEFPRTRRDSLLSWLSEYDWCCNQKYEVDYSLVE